MTCPNALPASAARRATLVALLGLLLLAPPAALLAAPPVVSVAPALRFIEVEKLLQQADWSSALALLRSQEARLTPDTGARAAWLARVAIAEAGSAQEEKARWHWAVANQLGSGLFDAEQLRALGAPAEQLGGNLPRLPGKAPAGMAVEAPGPDVRGEVKLRGEVPALAASPWAARQSLRLEVVVDEQGRLRDPLILSARSGEAAFKVLEAMLDWRFEPATKLGRPVAVVHTFDLNPPGRVPLAQIIRLSPDAASTEGMLRRQQWAEAAGLSKWRWQSLLDSSEPGMPTEGAAADRAALGLDMAFRALARAGQGGNEEDKDWARCRWEAAQSLLPGLYDLDLTPYGPAGEMVAAWRQEKFAAPFEPAAARPGAGAMARLNVKKPEKIAAPPPSYPATAKKRRIEAMVPIEAIIDTRGRVRGPALASSQEVGATVPLAASALDAVCDWRFQPATLDGKPIKVYYALTVGFKVH